MCGLIQVFIHTISISYNISSSGSKISKTGGANPKGAQPIIWPNFPEKMHENEEFLAGDPLGFVTDF